MTERLSQTEGVLVCLRGKNYTKFKERLLIVMGFLQRESALAAGNWRQSWLGQKYQ